MKRLYIEPTPISPEINLSPEDRLFTIIGNSSPEDVRALYYPVVEWLELFVGDTLEGDYKFTPGNPLRIVVDLHYFNSSSAKFLYDIFILLRKLKEQNVPLEIEWHYARRITTRRKPEKICQFLQVSNSGMLKQKTDTDERSGGALSPA